MDISYHIARGLQKVGLAAKYLIILLILAYLLEMTITYVFLWSSDAAFVVFDFIMKNISRGIAPDYVIRSAESKKLYNAHPLMLRLHLIPQIIMSICGLHQLWSGSRMKSNLPNHKLLGKVYAISNTLGMIGSWFLLRNLNLGLTEMIGFIGMLISTLGSTYMAVWMVKSGNISAHREWMIRSYFTNISSSLFFRVSWALVGYLAKGEAYTIGACTSWSVGFIAADVYMTAKQWTDKTIKNHEKID